MDEAILTAFLSLLNINPHATEQLIQLEDYVMEKILDEEEILNDEYCTKKKWYITYGKREAYLDVQKFMIRLKEDELTFKR